MALILCTGANRSLVDTRSLILQRAGHLVVTALGEPELIVACTAHQFDVAVVGQVVSTFEKQRILRLIRQHCPDVTVLELFSPSTGKQLPNADDWLEVPANVPSDLAERVSLLASKR